MKVSKTGVQSMNGESAVVRLLVICLPWMIGLFNGPLLGQDKVSVDELLEKSRRYQKEEKFGKAIEHVTLAIKKAPKDHRPYSLRGSLLIQEFAFNDSKKELDPPLKKNGKGGLNGAFYLKYSRKRNVAPNCVRVTTRTHLERAEELFVLLKKSPDFFNVVRPAFYHGKASGVFQNLTVLTKLILQPTSRLNSKA